MDSTIEKDGTQLQNNNFGTLQAFTFILLQNNNTPDNMTGSFVGKYEQVSTYVS